MLTKQATKHVEWYHEDFSDPEAVSGSSTKFGLVGRKSLFFVDKITTFFLWKTLKKIIKKLYKILLT